MNHHDDGIRENFPGNKFNDREDIHIMKERQNFNDIMTPHDEQVLPAIQKRN